MEYFAARVFYEEIKFFDSAKTENLLDYFKKKWLNSKILKGDNVTDQESDVLNFLVDMISYNQIKQKEMQKGSGNDDAQSKSNTLAKLVILAELVNKQAYGGSDNEVIPANISEKWNYNVLLISCSFDQSF